MRLILKWSNPSHFALADATVTCTGDGGRDALLAGPFRPGQQQALVDDGEKVTVAFVFQPAIGNAGAATTLDVIQRFRVVGTNLAPDDFLSTDPVQPANPRFLGGLHQLIGLTTVTGGGEPTVEVALDTTFVDVTEHVESTVRTPIAPGTRILCLTTGQAPMLWVAVAPAAAIEATRLQALTFFRPPHASGNYAPDASIFRDKAKLALNLQFVERFLTSPLPAAARPPDFALDQITFDNTRADPNAQLWTFLFCGFRKMLEDSQKALVLLLPLAHGRNWGVAEKAVKKHPALPELMLSAFKTLGAGGWVNPKVGREFPSEVNGARLGLGGFSEGGEPMWKALEAWPAAFQAVWAFDPNGLPVGGKSILTMGTREIAILENSAQNAGFFRPFRGFITGFYNNAAFNSLLQRPALAATMTRLPANPVDPNDVVKLVANPRLLHALAGFVKPDPKLWAPGTQLHILERDRRTKRVVRDTLLSRKDELFQVLHQFAVFGGDDGGSFFRQCLDGSRFT